MKSRRLAGRQVTRGMEMSSAIWVRQTNCSVVRRLAARKENGSCVASRNEVIRP